jgi:hypothetical protein
LLGGTPQPSMISALLAMPLKPAQYCTIFTLQSCSQGLPSWGPTHTLSLFCSTTPPQAYQARDP